MRADSRYSHALGKRICDQVANGAALSDIAGDIGLSPRTLYSWLTRYGGFKAMYEEAKTLAGIYTEDRLLVLCREARAITAQDGDARLQLEAIKMELDLQRWRLTKLMPQKYGDKSQLEVTGKDGESLLPQHTRDEDLAYLAMLAEIQEKTRK